MGTHKQNASKPRSEQHACLTFGHMWRVYVLELEAGEDGIPNIYVGHTCSLKRRLHDHAACRSCELVPCYSGLTVLECLKISEEGALGQEVAKRSIIKKQIQHSKLSKSIQKY